MSSSSGGTVFGIACVQLAASVLGGIVAEGLVLTFTFLKNHGHLPQCRHCGTTRSGSRGPHFFWRHPQECSSC